MNVLKPLGFAALGALVAVAAYGNVPPPPQPPPPLPQRPPAWEYKLLPVTFGNATGDEKVLNDLGAEGWEVVESAAATRGGGTVPLQTDARLVLRRARR